MGEYLRAEFWFARTGVGLLGYSWETEAGGTEKSRGRGGVTAVP